MQNDEHLMALVNASRSTLLRAATRLLGPAEAEDAVQDAYVRALEANAPALNAAQAWLLTVVRNLAIDRLRRRQWMAQWAAETVQAAQGDALVSVAPSAEADAALAQQATLALRRLAACVTPVEGAAVLLHAVFDASHAELVQATGRTEAASRQQCAALQACGGPKRRPAVVMGAMNPRTPTLRCCACTCSRCNRGTHRACGPCCASRRSVHWPYMVRCMPCSRCSTKPDAHGPRRVVWCR